MKEIISNTELVAYCGLYCGACRSYLKEKCPGCHENKKATWCKIRSCCMEKAYSSCADCIEFHDPKDCGNFDNFISKIFGFIFRTDRAASIQQVRKSGIQAYADDMTKKKSMSLKRQIQ